MTSTGSNSPETGLESQDMLEYIPDSNLDIDKESATELEYLRTILWGQRVRKTKQKTERVEAGLNQNAREMLVRLDNKLRTTSESQASALHTVQAQLAEQINENATRSSNLIRGTKQELSDRLDTLNDRLDSESHDLKNELTAYIDQRVDQQATQLRRTQEELTMRIETLAEDLFNQINQTHRSLSNQIAAQTAELDNRVKMLRSDSVQETLNLRGDIETRLEVVDKKLASRRDLGQLYMELSRRLYDQS